MSYMCKIACSLQDFIGLVVLVYYTVGLYIVYYSIITISKLNAPYTSIFTITFSADTHNRTPISVFNTHGLPLSTSCFSQVQFSNANITKKYNSADDLPNPKTKDKKKHPKKSNLKNHRYVICMYVSSPASWFNPTVSDFTCSIALVAKSKSILADVLTSLDHGLFCIQEIRRLEKLRLTVTHLKSYCVSSLLRWMNKVSICQAIGLNELCHYKSA